MILEDIIKSIREGEITSPTLIASLLESRAEVIRTYLDVAYANGRVDALTGETKSPYSEWKFPKNNETDISNSK